MKVLIFGVQPHSPHFETQLELMEDHGAAGDEVIYVSCDRALSHCDANPSNDSLFCRACEGKRRNGLKLLKHPPSVIPLSDVLSDEDGQNIQTGFESQQALLEHRCDDFDCGEAVTSSLLSHLRTIYPDFPAQADFVARAMRSTVRLYRASRRLLQQEKPERVYFFNGRAATGRCFLRACQQEGIHFFTHERGSTIDSYMLIENTVPHDVDYRNAEIKRHWEANPNTEEKQKIAEQFYARMRKGKLAYRETNYLKDQVSGETPQVWRDNHPRLVLFSSTETERAALAGFYARRIYSSLADMLTRIVPDLKARDFQGVFVVRMHPNSQDEYDHLLPHLESLKDIDFLHIIPPREKIDSYALLDSADTVMVVTSTLGMEATYSGIPSVSLERSNYDLLGATYSPQTHAEVIDLLMSELQPMDRLGAQMYGYYTLTFGQTFRYTTMKGQNKASFHGKKVRAPRYLDHLMKVRSKFRD